MKILMNSTKTMDMQADLPPLPPCSPPLMEKRSNVLGKELKKLGAPEIAKLMKLSQKMTSETERVLKDWNRKNQPQQPALFAFSGIVYMYLNARNLDKKQLRAAQKNFWILSGLYGLLRPLDLIENYRLEMGYKFSPRGYANLLEYWKEPVQNHILENSTKNEPILCLAAQEYVKVLDSALCDQRLITPVFKEINPDGSLKNALVYAKMARGALAAYILKNACKTPEDLMGFKTMGWKPSAPPPNSGSWLFTRPS